MKNPHEVSIIVINYSHSVAAEAHWGKAHTRVVSHSSSLWRQNAMLLSVTMPSRLQVVRDYATGCKAKLESKETGSELLWGQMARSGKPMAHEVQARELD